MMTQEQPRFVRKIPEGDSRERDVCNRDGCGHIAYKNPAILSGVLASDADGRVLLRQRNGQWELPRTEVRPGETSHDAALRLMKDAGFPSGQASRILTIDESLDHGQILFTFRGSLPSHGSGLSSGYGLVEDGLTGDPVLEDVMEAHARTAGQTEFAPGFLRRDFTLAAEGDGEIYKRPCGNCGHDRGEKPKIVSGVVATWGDKILLCRRNIEPRRGFWTLPAGFLELQETIREGAARETREESGAEVDIDDLLVIYESGRVSHIMTVFRAAMRSDALNPDPKETQEARLFAWNDIPWRELAFPMVKVSLERHAGTKDRKGPGIPLHVAAKPAISP